MPIEQKSSGPLSFVKRIEELTGPDSSSFCPKFTPPLAEQRSRRPTR